MMRTFDLYVQIIRLLKNEYNVNTTEKELKLNIYLINNLEYYMQPIHKRNRYATDTQRKHNARE